MIEKWGKYKVLCAIKVERGDKNMEKKIIKKK